MGRPLNSDEMKRYNPHAPGGLDPATPEDVLAEAALVSSMIVDPSEIPKVLAEGLEPRHFTDHAHRAVFGVLTDMHSEGRPVGVVTVLSRMKETKRGNESVYDFIGGQAYWAIVSKSQGITRHAAYYAESIITQFKRRKLQDLADEITRQIDRNEPVPQVEGLIEFYAGHFKELRAKEEGPKAMNAIIETYTDLRAAVIDGLLRVAETLNVVAPTKRGKSWLVIGLVLCIVTGRRWLGLFQCVQGKVLVLDNELHPETSAHRIPKVADAMGIKLEEYGDRLLIDNLRGRGMDLEKLGAYLEQFQPGEFSVIVLDALYRFLPRGVDENSNSDMTRMYNLLDSYAQRMQCSFICVHHSSKGSQADKSVTDTGSGAGAQSRATDSHVVLRQHEDPAAVVLDLAARSWPPLDAPIVLRWEWPVWFVDHQLDPAALHRPSKRAKAAATVEPSWDAERFAKTFGTPEPKPMLAIVEAACAAGLSDRKAVALVKRAAATGKLHKWPTGDAREVAYSTVKAPTESLKPAKAKKPKKGKK